MNRCMVCAVALMCVVMSVSIAEDAKEAKEYTDDEILKMDSSYFFERLEKPDKGYNVYAAPWALAKKCNLTPELALPILNRATQIYLRSGSDFAKRQCLIIFSMTRAVVTLPILLDALQNGDSKELRSLAASCLPGYRTNKKMVVDALESALETEKDADVLRSIRSALQRRGLK